MPDATITTTVPTHNVVLNASTYDTFATVAMLPPRTPPTAAACCNASARECVAFAGSPVIA